MPNAPEPTNELQRLVALMSCDVLDTAPEQSFDDTTRLASRLCDAPIALVSLVDCDRQWFKSRVGLDAEQTPREHAFCAYTILGDSPLVIEDATRDPRTAENPLVTGAPGLRAYAGVPLILSDGQAVGTLCVLDLEPRSFSGRQLDDLESLGRRVVAELELRRANQRLHHHAEAAKAQNQAKTAFLHSLSHEIRTPLTSILGYVDLLTVGVGAGQSTERDEMVQVVQRNAKHLLTLVNDLLDLARIEADRLTIERDVVDLSAIVQDVFTTVRPLAQGKGLSLSEVSDGVPARLMLDPVRVKQVLLNLVHNAVKFTEQGRVEVRTSYDPDQGELAVEVRDTGVGMSREQLARVRLFQPFTPSRPDTRLSLGGSGLGLSICHRLLELMNATISVESQQGRGTSFFIALPANPARAHAAPARPADPTPPAAEHHGATIQRPLAGRRILVAEDQPDNQRLVQHHLIKAGADVVLVDNGQSACDAVAQRVSDEGFDLVLMDMQMPLMDGFEATTQLRSRGVRVPIIALTASTTDADVERCVAAGCVAHLPKPFSRDEVVQMCARHLQPDGGRKRQRKQSAA